jgi:hypothetical protein
MFNRHHQQQPAPEADYCPRCHHLSVFCQAPSDHYWVCQRCLRYRVRQCSQHAHQDTDANQKEVVYARR